MTEVAQRPRGRKRPPPRVVEVAAVERLTPRMAAVSLTGEALRGFAPAAPTSHVKVFFPSPDGVLALPTPGPDGPVWPESPRPTMRTYTPRRYDPERNLLEIHFVLHGDGPAARWAEHAAVGDQVAVAGPGGRFQLNPDAASWWIGADESALPAVATLLEALPPTVSAQVHLEVADAADEFAFDAPPTATITWHHRSDPAAYGEELRAAAQRATFDADTAIWVACEAGGVRRIRADLLAAGVAPAALTTRGYWRLDTPNHPDHDYGED